MKRVAVLFLAIVLSGLPLGAKTVKGTVSCEGKGLAGVMVSDGYRFAKTDGTGAFKLSTHKDARFVFVITPSGYVAPFESGAPQFYLPLKGTKRFDFSLQQFGNTKDYYLLSVSDPQMANKKHLKRFTGKPLGDLRGMAARLGGTRPTVGMALGDIAWNNLEFFAPYKEAIATTGIPFYAVIGNHDFIQNQSGIAAGAAYEAAFGPYNYAFFLGNDLVIGLNNIQFVASGHEEPSKSSNNYTEGYSRETLDFVKGLLAYVPKGTHILIAQHSPIQKGLRNVWIEHAEELLSLLDGYPVDMLSGHTHVMEKRTVSASVRDHNAASIGGAWWSTDRCKDGTPRGYEIFSSEDGRFTSRWHNIDYPDEFQAEFIPMGAASCHANELLANVWDADERWTVSWSEDGGPWQKAKRVADVSPVYVREILAAFQNDPDKIPGYKNPRATPHYYAASPSQYARRVSFCVKAPDGRQWTETLCPDRSYIDLQAHRGGAGLMPENTVSSMRKAMDLKKINTLEFDLQISSDGKVVVSHDNYFHSRYAIRPDGSLVGKDDPKEYIYTMPYDSVVRYEVGLRKVDQWPTQQKVSEHKPLASDLIDFIEDYARKKGLSPMRYNIEVKSRTGKGEGTLWPDYKTFVDTCIPLLLSKNLGDRLVVQCFDVRALNYMRAKYPEVKLSYLTSKVKDVVQLLGKLDFTPEWWSPHYEDVTTENVAYCHALGVKVVPWTVDEKSDIQKMADYGVDAIISNYPDRLIEVLR